jgi:hypothetical protein
VKTEKKIPEPSRSVLDRFYCIYHGKQSTQCWYVVDKVTLGTLQEVGQVLYVPYIGCTAASSLIKLKGW